MYSKKIVLEYSNLAMPYLVATAYDKMGAVEKKIEIQFTQSDLSDGAIYNADKVIARFTEFPNMYPIVLVVACRKSYKNSLVLPKMSLTRAQMVYAKEKKSFDRNFYTTVTNYVAYGNKHIFDSYFIPNNIVACFTSIARVCKTKVVEIITKGMYLFEKYNFIKDCLFLRIKRNSCSMLLVDQGKLLTSYDFEFGNVADIKNNVIMVLSHYQTETYGAKVTNCAIDSDIIVDLGFDFEPIHIHVNPYFTQQ